MKDFMLLMQENKKSMIFATISNIYITGLCSTIICNRCHETLMISMNDSDIYILNIKNGNHWGN